MKSFKEYLNEQKETIVESKAEVRGELYKVTNTLRDDLLKAAKRYNELSGLMEEFGLSNKSFKEVLDLEKTLKDLNKKLRDLKID